MKTYVKTCFAVILTVFALCAGLLSGCAKSKPDSVNTPETIAEDPLAPDVQLVTVAGQTFPDDTTEVDLSDLGITDISELSALPSLITVNLEKNNISDVAPLSSLGILTYLNLNDNQISNISPLGAINGLVSAELARNNISDITAMGSQKRLWRLDLSDNQVSDVTPLGHLSELKLLYLANNNISDVTPLSTLKNIYLLDLSNNNISDVTPLLALNGSESEADDDVESIITRLTLSGNPLTQQQIGELQEALPDCEIVF